MLVVCCIDAGPIKCILVKVQRHCLCDGCVIGAISRFFGGLLLDSELSLSFLVFLADAANHSF